MWEGHREVGSVAHLCLPHECYGDVQGVGVVLKSDQGSKGSQRESSDQVHHQPSGTRSERERERERERR